MAIFALILITGAILHINTHKYFINCPLNSIVVFAMTTHKVNFRKFLFLKPMMGTNLKLHTHFNVSGYALYIYILFGLGVSCRILYSIASYLS